MDILDIVYTRCLYLIILIFKLYFFKYIFVILLLKV